MIPMFCNPSWHLKCFVTRFLKEGRAQRMPEYYQGLGLNGLPEQDAVRSADVSDARCCSLGLSAVIAHLLLEDCNTGETSGAREDRTYKKKNQAWLEYINSKNRLSSLKPLPARITFITMRTTINLSVIIVALAAWAAARPTIQENNYKAPLAKGPFPSLLDRPSCYGGYSSPQLIVISTCSKYSRG
ncbi:hypothetical protein BJV78DRAFT_473179 [Lactifluus subvellereus]|nr:hypothetical protein BJV78DRAFT_473179 [Lactifluus subvellereus]